MRVADCGGDTEVHELHAAGRVRRLPESIGHQNVVRLQVPVNDPAGVHMLKCVGEVEQQRFAVAWRHVRIARHISEGTATYEVEDEPEALLRGQLEQRVAGDDRRVLQLGDRVSLAPGTLGAMLRQGGEIEELQRLLGAVEEIADPPDRSLRSPSERIEQDVPIDADPRAQLHDVLSYITSGDD
ncbi:hypothetical protein WME94_51465 [Sorangium sp. So ce429]